MANDGYNGTLLIFGGEGGTPLPKTYIRVESYKATPDQRQDLNSYVDANGYLHRNALPHTRTKVEWETPYLTNTQVAQMNEIFRNAMTNTTERKVTVYYYDNETDSYTSGEFYMPDAQYTIYNADDRRILYAPIRFALIEY